MLFSYKYEGNPRTIVWNGPKKFIQLKTHLLTNFTVAFADIFQDVDRLLFYLIVDSRILQYCFCQQPY